MAPSTVAECVSSGLPVAVQVTVYPSIGLPPSEAGAVQLTMAEPSPGVAVTSVGAPGTSVSTAANVAVTARSASIVTEHDPVPEQSPLHPANVEPRPGVAVRFTGVPSSNVAVQVVPQSIPAGALVTVPVPLPVSVTARSSSRLQRR